MYLNSGTAAGVLGGPVQFKGDKNVCRFTLEHPPVTKVLEIRVETLDGAAKFRNYLAHCAGPAVALNAIGNEAVACSAASTGKETPEQVIGRVRNQVFLIRVSSSTENGAVAELRAQAKSIAEHVAGNLF